MKIAYVYDSIYPYIKGGIERRIWELSTRLARMGHDIHIFGPKFWEGESILQKDGVYLHGVCRPPEKRYVNGRRSITEPIYFARKVFLPLLKERFDVIDCPIFPYFHCYSAKLVSLIKGTPLVINWFEVWNDYWYEYLGKKGVIGKAIERVAVKLPHRIVVETESTKQILISWGYHPDNFAIVPSGLLFEKIQQIAEPDREEDKTDAIYVGRLVDYKGVRTLVESIAHLNRNGKKVTVGIIGDGPDSENLKVLANELDITDRIKFHGWVEEEDRVISLMKGAKVFVYAATPLGGWALTPLEANACGLPVVTSRSGAVGNNEVITDNYNGLVADRETAELIAEKIELLLENAELREELRKNSLIFARNYDWNNQALAMEKVYRSCLKIKTKNGEGK